MSIDRGKRHALGVDFGTSNTVAVARWPDGRARPILIDGSPLLPSAVFAERDGQLIVGRDAVHSARLDPARFEPNPKRRIDDGTVLLGDREVDVADLLRAVLARIAEEWHRAVGPVRPTVTLTCPATWGAARRTMLADAAASAGLEGARLVAEPVAAATYFAQILGREVPIGSVVVVHDFGAGTFDASVVARTADGFEVLAVDGRDDIGGLDVDAAVIDHLGRSCAKRDPAAWHRLTDPTTVEERRAQRQLWDDVRVAKERLSRTQSADLVIPLLDCEVHLTRDELETLAEPIIAQTVEVTTSVMRWADLAEGRLAGVFLVGGASRIPLVATMLHRALDEAPVVIEQPELVVAEGSILAEAALLTAGPAAPGPTEEMRLPSAPSKVATPATPDPAPAASAPAALASAPAALASAPAALASAPAALALASALVVSARADVAGPSVSGPGVSGPGVSDSGDSRSNGSGQGDSQPDGPGDTQPAGPGDSQHADSGLGDSGPGDAGPGDSGPDNAQPVGSDGSEPGDSAGPTERVAVDEQSTDSTAPTQQVAGGVDRPIDEPWPVRRWDEAAALKLHEELWPGGQSDQQGDGLTKPAVDPWPHAVAELWVEDPRRTVVSGAWLDGAQWPADAADATARPDPSVPSPATRARGVVGVPRPPPAAPARTKPTPQPKPARGARPRRRGWFRRFVQMLLSIGLLVAAPIVAAVVAYGYGNGTPMLDDAQNLAEELVRVIESW